MMAACSEPATEMVTQEQESESGARYYTYHNGGFRSNGIPHYLIRVGADGRSVDTLYVSENHFSFELDGNSVAVTTCRAEPGQDRVRVVEDPDFNCTTNRPIIARRTR
jgi:hypothetical protein